MRPGRKISRAVGAAALLLGTVAGCSRQEVEPDPLAAPAAAGESAGPGVLFRDVTANAGLAFVHRNGGTGQRYIPEIMGAGGAALDYDGDGWTDLYFVQSGAVPGGDEPAAPSPNRLYRNLGAGSFVDVTERAGVGDAGYGMGSVAADYDNDGDPDLYVVNLGPDVLLRNDGDGTFSDVTRAVGIDSPLWGSSAAFLDAEGDGRLDLYVSNYLDFSLANHIVCGSPSEGLEAYCHPDVYPMAPDAFFRQRADGTFAEATVAAGLVDTTGKGLGVVAVDLTGDHRTDLYVANDSTPNFLYRNRGDGTFEEVGLFLGVAYNEDGRTEAGMGTDAGDLNGDGRMDLFVTNLDHETNSLYLAAADGFSDQTRSSGLFRGSFLQVGFGTDLADLDNDGDLDIVVANGHIIDNIELFDDAQSFAQPAQVFFNDGAGTFTELAAAAVGDPAVPRVGRGTITADLDHDGRLDLAITSNNDQARLFRNRWRAAGNWISVLLESERGNRGALGARVTVEADGREQVEERKAGSSYQTAGDAWLHFGLGASTRAGGLTVRWPDGQVQVLRDLPANRFYRLRQAE